MRFAYVCVAFHQPGYGECRCGGNFLSYRRLSVSERCAPGCGTWNMEVKKVKKVGLLEVSLLETEHSSRGGPLFLSCVRLCFSDDTHLSCGPELVTEQPSFLN